MVTLKQKCTSRRKCRRKQKKERVFHKMLEERKQRSRIQSVRYQEYTLSEINNTLCSSEINNYAPSELLHCGSRLTAVFQCCSVWKQTYCSVPVFQCSEGDYHKLQCSEGDLPNMKHNIQPEGQQYFKSLYKELLN